MNDDRTFVEGYIEGWKSVLGAGVGIKGIPSHAIPAGKRPYQEGLVRGTEDAHGEKGIKHQLIGRGGRR